MATPLVAGSTRGTLWWRSSASAPPASSRCGRGGRGPSLRLPLAHGRIISHGPGLGSPVRQRRGTGLRGGVGVGEAGRPGAGVGDAGEELVHRQPVADQPGGSRRRPRMAPVSVPQSDNAAAPASAVAWVSAKPAGPVQARPRHAQHGCQQRVCRRAAHISTQDLGDIAHNVVIDIGRIDHNQPHGRQRPAPPVHTQSGHGTRSTVASSAFAVEPRTYRRKISVISPTTSLARNASIPVLGVNLGRIGFLAEAEAEESTRCSSRPARSRRLRTGAGFGRRWHFCGQPSWPVTPAFRCWASIWAASAFWPRPRRRNRRGARAGRIA